MKPSSLVYLALAAGVVWWFSRDVAPEDTVGPSIKPENPVSDPGMPAEPPYGWDVASRSPIEFTGYVPLPIRQINPDQFKTVSIL